MTLLPLPGQLWDDPPPRPATAGWFQVRCPACGKMAAEAKRGSVVRVKCIRCLQLYVKEAPVPEVDRG